MAATRWDKGILYKQDRDGTWYPIKKQGVRLVRDPMTGLSYEVTDRRRETQAEFLRRTTVADEAILSTTLSLYGSPEFFRRKLSEGYKEVAFGKTTSLDYVDNERIVGLFVVYNKDGRVAIYETICKPSDIEVIKGIIGEKREKPREYEMDNKEFERYCDHKKIKLEERVSLASLIKD